MVGYCSRSSIRWGRTDRCSASRATVAEEAPRRTTGTWSLGRRSWFCCVFAAVVGWLSEILVGSTEGAVHVGLSEVFVGLIVVPIIGNAAEHSSAVMMARQESDGPGRVHRDRLERSGGVADRARARLRRSRCRSADGSRLHPVRGDGVALAVAVRPSVVRDAQSDWLEGAFLLLVYAMLASRSSIY